MGLPQENKNKEQESQEIPVSKVNSKILVNSPLRPQESGIETKIGKCKYCAQPSHVTTCFRGK